MYSLDKKNALIFGGTSGIGKAVAANFVACGATVTVAGRRNDGEQVASEVGATFLRCDVTDEQAVMRCLADVAGSLDILVLNAGIAADEGSLASISTDQMKQIMETNFNGTFHALKHAPEHLSDGASVVATGSVAGSGITHAGAGVYAASKASIAYLCRTSAIELADRGIRVNVVCPAVIAGTGMMTEDDGGEEAQFYGRLTAMGRMGRIEEVVGVYNFLAGDGATFITGQEIRVDGGLTAGLGNPLMMAASS